MLLGRKLLYHRGIDDSAGNYITNYLLFVICTIFSLCFVGLFVKNRGSSWAKSGIAKSTYAITGFCALVGIASFIAGLTHQFLQTIEPYEDQHDSQGWLIAWRFGAAFSGAISFVFLLLSEYMLSSEKLLRFNKVAFRIYYIFATLVCVGITAHSFWLISVEDNPWTLTLTFSLVFASAFLELVVMAIVLLKRYRADRTKSAIYKDAVALNTETLYHKMLITTITPFVKGAVESNSQTEKKNEENILNNNTTQTPLRRTDLLLHFIAPLIFVVGGVFQILMGSIGKCSQHRNSESVGCPLPDEFNHNTVFHILQIISVATFFAAELCAIKHRQKKLILETQSTEENDVIT